MTNNNSASGGKKSFQNAKWIGLKFEEGIFSFQEQKIRSPMQNPIHSELNYFGLEISSVTTHCQLYNCRFGFEFLQVFKIDLISYLV